MSQKILWQIAPKAVDYPDALESMETHARAVFDGMAPERAWLLEHPPLYTLGTSAKKQDVLGSANFPTYETGRGGQVTYHGPGQRVVYLQLNLKNRVPDLKKYIFDLEEWIIRALRRLNVKGERRDGRVGIWVNTPKGEAKIAAIGVRVKKWVTLHGIALNVNPDLSHYKDIVPCGISDYGVTSLQDLGVEAPMDQIDTILQDAFQRTFGPCEFVFS